MANKRDDPVLRIAGVLKQLAEEQSYSQVAERIREANAPHGGRSVERRKLKRLVDGEDVPLLISELIALDTFLTPLGEGLADKPLFERPTPIRSLAAKAQVTIVLAAYARPKGRRNDMSRWDVRSMAHLLRAVEKCRPETHVDIRDVLCDKERPAPPSYLGESGPSVCSIGSPRASYATEIMLAEMFGVEPFDRGSAELVPFRFIWSPAASGRHSSSFRIDASQVFDAKSPLISAIKDGRVWGALQTEDDLYLARAGKDMARDKKGKIWKSHGIVVAQQRANGQVWTVCAGLTGPGTYAATVALANEQTGAVPEARSGHSAVRWDIVECTVDSDPHMLGDNRIVTSQDVVGQGYWDPDASTN